MKTIVEMKFGSHLYGTSTPASDTDYKAVFVPTCKEILLGRINAVITDKRSKDHGERNTPNDVDREAYALHRYLSLLAEGQTVALDMLFAPDWAMVSEPSMTWRSIQSNRERFLSRRAASFIGYCRTQANKYGIKGSRVHAVRNIVEWFDAAIAEHGHLARLEVAAATLPAFIAERSLEHTSIVPIDHPSRPDPIPHLECCNRKAPFFASLKDASAIYKRLFDEYGERARKAERNEGVDWKALSHAVRVGHEAIELLNTGAITFPLPNAEHILAIKRGSLPYAAVSEEIEGLLESAEAAQLKSSLPEKPDHSFIDHLVFQVYGATVFSDFLAGDTETPGPVEVALKALAALHG